MKKDLIGVGSAMLIFWFVVLVIFSSIIAFEPYIVAFWSILGISIIVLALGVLLRDKKNQCDNNMKITKRAKVYVTLTYDPAKRQEKKRS